MIVGIVSTWNEGKLAAGAIRTLLECCDVVKVCDGPIGAGPHQGEPTVLDGFKREQRVNIWHGRFADEAAKRNAMLERTRNYPAPVWGVYLDGDELLLGARWLPDLIDAATSNVDAGQEPASIPLLITEVDGSVGRVHRVLRLDLLERHVLSMSQFRFHGSGAVVTLPLLPVWRPGEPMTHLNRPPLQGEPHIHHRAYYRPVRADRERLHAREISDFQRLEQAAGHAPSGTVPREEEGGFGPLELSPEEEQVLRSLTPFGGISRK